MFFYISKLIDFLLEPTVWFIAILLLAYLKVKLRKKLILWSILLLYLFSNEFIFMEVCRLYEIPSTKDEVLQKKYEAAIILGGMITYNDQQELIEFEGSSDRFLNILPLYFDNKVKKILIAGGSGRLLQDEKESRYLRDYLIQIGVKRSDILIEDRSKNTYENAKYSAQLIRDEKLKGPFLLSTSATHMRRSLACFEKQGITVDPYAVDFFTKEREFNPDRLFRPKVGILKNWTALIHEWIGFIFYSIAGYC